MAEQMSQAELQEKLSKMSPEELKEWQKQNCPFCQIVSGKIPSKKVYEDNLILAILDINPASKGHTLVLPKEHYPIMPIIPVETQKKLYNVVKGISEGCMKGLLVQGTTIFVANGGAAGQQSQHFMMHVIPRENKDGVEALKIPDGVIDPNVEQQLITALPKAFAARLDGDKPDKSPIATPDEKSQVASSKITDEEPEDDYIEPLPKTEAELDEVISFLGSEESDDSEDEDYDNEENLDDDSEDKQSQDDDKIELETPPNKNKENGDEVHKPSKNDTDKKPVKEKNKKKNTKEIEEPDQEPSIDDIARLFG